MILEVSRGHIKVEIRGREITVPGEMFFPPNDKMGFAVFKSEIKSWDSSNDSDMLTKEEIEEVIKDIQEDFARGGHTLEIE